MKLFSFALMCLLSTSAFALGGFESYSEGNRTVLKTMVSELGISDNDNSVKEALYKELEYVLEEDWYSYWLGYNDLSASKYEGKKGFVQFLMPTKAAGIFIVTLSKRTDVEQIIITVSQIRHGEQDDALKVFKERKSNSDKYEVRTENDSFAMLQKSGAVNFNTFDIDSGTASIVYTNQTYVDL